MSLSLIHIEMWRRDRFRAVPLNGYRSRAMEVFRLPDG